MSRRSKSDPRSTSREQEHGRFTKKSDRGHEIPSSPSDVHKVRNTILRGAENMPGYCEKFSSGLSLGSLDFSLFIFLGQRVPAGVIKLVNLRKRFVVAFTAGLQAIRGSGFIGNSFAV